MIGLHETALLASTRRRVLEALSFPEMHRRYEAVEQAHASTFRWIYSGGVGHTGSSDHATRASATGRFKHWLLSPRGILHVSGKLGSGKSTLMKLLFESPEVGLGLKEWAGNYNYT